jgi:glutamine amidotransferase PdxT
MKLSPDDITTEEAIAVTVAVQQDHILATAFHPELTNDDRFHRYFLKMVQSHKTSQTV